MAAPLSLPRVFGFTPGLFSELSFACHAWPDDTTPETDFALRPAPAADLVVREVRGDWVRFDDPAQRRAHASVATAEAAVAVAPTAIATNTKSPSSLVSSYSSSSSSSFRRAGVPPPPSSLSLVPLHASPSSSKRADADTKSEADDDDNNKVPSTPPPASAATSDAGTSPGPTYASPAAGTLRQHWTRWRSASGVTILEPTVYKFAPKMAAMGAALNIRDSPSGTGAIVGKCESDTVFVPVAVAGSWLRVVRPEKLSGVHEGTDDVWVMRKQPGAGGMVLLVPEGAPDDMDRIFLGIAQAAAKAAARAAAEAEAEEAKQDAGAAEVVAGGVGLAEDGSLLSSDCKANAGGGDDDDDDGRGGGGCGAGPDGQRRTSISISGGSSSSSSRRSSRAASPVVGELGTSGGGDGAVASAVPARMAVSPWDERPLSPMKDLTAFETKLSPEKLKEVAALSPLVSGAGKLPAAVKDEEEAKAEAGSVVLEALDLRDAHDSREEENDAAEQAVSSSPSSLSASGIRPSNEDSNTDHNNKAEAEAEANDGAVVSDAALAAAPAAPASTGTCHPSAATPCARSILPRSFFFFSPARSPRPLSAPHSSPPGQAPPFPATSALDPP